MSAAPAEIRIGAELASARTCSMRPRRRPITTASSCRSVAARAPTSTTTRTRRARRDSLRRLQGGEQTIAIVAQFLADRFGLRFVARRPHRSIAHPAGALQRHPDLSRESRSDGRGSTHLEIDVENRRGEKC